MADLVCHDMCTTQCANDTIITIDNHNDSINKTFIMPTVPPSHTSVVTIIHDN